MGRVMRTKCDMANQMLECPVQYCLQQEVYDGAEEHQRRLP